MKKRINKFISIFIALLMIFSISTISPIKAFADELLAQKVHVIVENTTYTEKDGSPWEGTLVDDYIEIKKDMTMMDAIVAALEENEISQTGAENGYISEINDLSEFDGGSGSGWMGTKNDWMVNQGFDQFKVEKDDEIKVMYTRNLGIDLDADYNNKVTTLKSIEFSDGKLSSEFDSNTKEYTLELENIEKIRVKPNASNKHYQARIYKGDVDVSKNGYKRNEDIKVLDGDIITIICGDKSWDGSDQNLEPTIYTFNIKSNVKPNTAPTLNKESDIQTINLGETYSIDLSTIFTDAENDKLTYTVSVNGKDEEVVDSNYSFKPDKAGNYKFEFQANDGREKSETYKVKLSVDSGDTYKVSLSNTENGNISVDVSEGKLNTVVTLTVSPNDGFAMDTLEIKDNAGNDVERKIDQEKSDGINFIYTFELPTSDVNIYATFGKAYTYSFGGHSWYGLATVDVYNKYGEVIKPKEYKNSNYYYSSFHLLKGTYKYTTYGKEGEIGKEGTIVVKDTKTEQGISLFAIHIQISGYYVKDGDSTDVNIKITDPDGNLMDIKPFYVYKNNKYTVEHYIFESKGRGKQYKFEITAVDDNVDSKITRVTRCDSYDETTVYISNSIQYYTSHGDNDIQVELESKAEQPIEYKVSKGANLHLYSTYGVAYKQFSEIEPVSVDTSDSKYDSYKYQIQKDYYMLMAGGGDTEYVKTYKSYFLIDPKEITESITIDLTKKEDYKTNPYGYPMWDDIYTNIKDEGSYINMEVGENKRLETFRVWQGTTSPVSNKFFEPDKHYEIISGKDCLSLTKGGGEGREYMTMKAKKAGVAVIKITYDEMYEANSVTTSANIYTSKAYGFNKIQEEHTGIVIVNIGGSRGDIKPNIKVRDRDWTKYDTFYFTGDTTYPDGKVVKGKGYGEYTFTPSDGVTVETHDPIHIDEDFENNWTKYEPNSNGSYTLKLKTGRNIIRLTKGDKVVYFVMNAMQSDITISNKTNEGQSIKVGDEVNVSFTNLECPIYKMTAIYNPGFPDRTYMVYNLNGETVEGPHSQYAVKSPFTFTADKSGVYKLSQGKVHAEHMGSSLDTHCVIPDDGLPPNLNAGYGANDVNFNILPDVEIKVDGDSQDEIAVSFDADNGKDVVTKSVKSGEALNYTPQNPTKEGYTFVGWYKNTDDITTEYKSDITYTENTTYKAKWAHVNMLGAQGKNVVNDKSGIRFGTRLYTDGDEIVEKGTLIIPFNLLSDGEAITLNTPKVAKSVGRSIYKENKDENYIEYLGTIVNIPKAQFNRQMTATSYVIYKDKAGNEYTVYAPYKNNSISVNDLLENN